MDVLSKTAANTKQFGVIRPHAVLIPDESPIKRDATRDKKWIDSTYAEKYDDITVFFDIVIQDKKLILSGPPLRNLETFIENADIYVDGKLAKFVSSQELERTQLTIFTVPDVVQQDSHEVKILIDKLSINQTMRVCGEVQKALNGKKVLVTLQKDEDLQWIEDWIRYYVKVHDVDAVLIYDNSSTSYTCDDIIETISRIDGLSAAFVVNWNFKYGPQGAPWTGKDVPWDSDFCQIGALQNARYGHCSEAIGWINADVDELVISRNGESVFDALAKAGNGIIGYSGEWVANYSINLSDGELPRYWNFPYLTGNKCGSKWTANSQALDPSAHPTAHYMRKINYPQDDNFFIAHYKALNSGWKIPGRKETKSSPNNRLLNSNELLLAASVATVFPVESYLLFSNLFKENVELLGVDTGKMSTLALLLFLFVNSFEPDKCSWTKKWNWKDTVGVLEYRNSEHTIAFDIYGDDSSVSMNVSTRNQERSDQFKTKLYQTFGNQTLDEIPSGKGVRLINISNDQSYILALAQVRSMVNKVYALYPMIAKDSVLNSYNPPLLKVNPLKNLRGEPEYDVLAAEIKKRSAGKRVLYVQNHGNWGDALIHKGTLQFLQHYGIEYTLLTWPSMLSLIGEYKKLGIHNSDNLVLSGGGGGWRYHNSGSLSRARAIASVFENVLVLPHTYATGPLSEALGEVKYFARDKTLSVSNIPSCSFCHDMAFFLQIPNIIAGQSLGDGVFLRSDKEINPVIKNMKEKYGNTIDLSMWGNHDTQVSPFFQIISNFSRVITDRMHVAIAGALLQKEVVLIEGDYGKASAVYDATMLKHYPNVSMIRLD